MKPIVTKKPKPSWCHLHEQWECYFIDGIGEEVGLKDLAVGCCHEKATKKQPWCDKHKPGKK